MSNLNFSDDIEDYTVGKKLGQGSFGYVHLCEYFHNSYAIKILQKQVMDRKTQERVRSEVKIHKQLENKHIISLYHFFEDNEAVYLIMELGHQSLASYIKNQKSRRCSEYRARILMNEILTAVTYLHGNGIIHRDLSTANILLDENVNIKIIDFGLATMREKNSNEPNFTMCGTPNFLAPEILGRKGHDTKSDVFSLGCVFYNILDGNPPFNTTSTKATLERVKNLDYKMPEGLTVEAENLIRRLLQTNPMLRPTLQEVQEDPFLSPKKFRDGPKVSRDSAFVSGNNSSDPYSVTNSNSHSNYAHGSYHSNSKISRPNILSKSHETPNSIPNMIPNSTRFKNRQTPLRAMHTYRNNDDLGAITEEIYSRPAQTLDDSVIEESTRINENGQLFQGMRKSNSHNNLKKIHLRQTSEPELMSKFAKKMNLKPKMLPSMVPHLKLKENSGVSSSFHKEPDGELQRPLSCIRLRNENNKGGASRSTLISATQGSTLEMMKSGVVVQVFHVTSDGMTIYIGIPKQKRPLSEDGIPINCTNEFCRDIQRYSFNDLPHKYYKKYKHLRTLCDVIRSKTPKVTIYSELAKCILFENASANIHTSGCYEAKFYKPESKVELMYENETGTNRKLTKLVFQVPNVCHFTEKIFDLNQFGVDVLRKRVVEDIGAENEADQKAVEGYYDQIRHAWEGRSEAQKKEMLLSESEAKNECNSASSNSGGRGNFVFSIFPVCIGIRPNTVSVSNSTTPLSTAPNSARNTTSSKTNSSSNQVKNQVLSSQGNNIFQQNPNQHSNQNSNQYQSSSPHQQNTTSHSNFRSNYTAASEHLLGSINPSEIKGYQVSPPQHREGSMAISRNRLVRGVSPHKQHHPLQNSIGSVQSLSSHKRDGSFNKQPISTEHGYINYDNDAGVVNFMFDDKMIITKIQDSDVYSAK